MSATFIEAETVDGQERRWFRVNGEEFAITSDSRILDGDGKPLNEGDAEFDRVRQEIGDAQ